jgi:hypothetical protein
MRERGLLLARRPGLAQYAPSSDGDLLPATAPVAVAMLAARLAARLRRGGAAGAVIRCHSSLC